MSYGTTTGNSKGTWPIPKTSPFQLHDLVTIEIARKQYVRGAVLGTHDRDGDNLRIRFLEGATRIIHKSSLTKLPDKNITPKLKPCPLCGGFPFIESHRDQFAMFTNDSRKKFGTRIFCTTCGCSTGRRIALWDAIIDWETRDNRSKEIQQKERIAKQEALAIEERIQQEPRDICDQLKNASIEALEWMIQHTVVTDYGKYCHDLTHGLYSEFYERYTGKSNAFALNYAGFLNSEYVENYQDYLLNEHRWSKENADLRQ